ncbi:S-adenosylmethionine synthetase N-terminal domain-containing protein [Rhodoferax sediminis]|uniref:S-adenosylmethionine synthetase N-terminal domain-containing protein n=1 Tax=Rhodoferax sediminis TaxID=2509614 RepID=A0A515D9Y0_9BURK|nr:S-adenosylmethionine synthetase N-terminal domain-containing protein [Rhodoferax sediminis]QDL37210.1 hypothetical protein EUB48_07855 [Rhodoferax sediminis]
MVFFPQTVAEGHLDKLAHQISDRVLDAFVARDPNARAAYGRFGRGDLKPPWEAMQPRP